jgi:hypothetical protein
MAWRRGKAQQSTAPHRFVKPAWGQTMDYRAKIPKIMILRVHEATGEQDVPEKWRVLSDKFDEAEKLLRAHPEMRGRSVEFSLYEIVDATDIDGSPRVLGRV